MGKTDPTVLQDPAMRGSYGAPPRDSRIGFLLGAYNGKRTHSNLWLGKIL